MVKVRDKFNGMGRFNSAIIDLLYVFFHKSEVENNSLIYRTFVLKNLTCLFTKTCLKLLD